MMKSAADPYEFFRWKSSCGRLVVRTTWVKGVRHVVLSDDDDFDDRGDRWSEKEKRQRHPQRKNANKTTANRAPLSAVNANDNLLHEAVVGYGGGDESYVERVLQWLQKPSGMLETRQKPMSAPGNDGVRRPALIKTCSIPENRFEEQQVVERDCMRPTKSTKSGYTKNHQKTELHVHMPSVCPTVSNDNGKDIDAVDG